MPRAAEIFLLTTETQRPERRILFPWPGERRPGENAIAFGERHFSPGVIVGYGLWVQVDRPEGCALLPDRTKKKVPSLLSVTLW
jgi:hypothetical protein